MRILEAAGYEVTQAPGGAEALADWRQVDVLVTDVVMPGHDRPRARRARARRSRPGCAVVYMSGHTEDIVVLDGAREREIHFVQKPFTRDSLLAVVAESLAARMRAGVTGAGEDRRRRSRRRHAGPRDVEPEPVLDARP